MSPGRAAHLSRSNAMRHGPLDQKMIFHPQQTWRIRLRDNRR
jgi:hypothetical protein